ncbi:MAG: 4-hydroxy-3-methylbut-2-enyl diphosphate reductase [Francisellaceae bacterium]
MKILLAQPRGFCAGVSRAIDVVEQVLRIEKAPVYVRHEVVHNRYVVEDLKNKGAIFIDELTEIPDNSVVVFSAHGVSKLVRSEAKLKNLTVYDATCPLVTKVHIEVQKASEKNMECILIGHKGHPEVVGTLGQYQSRNAKIYLVESLEDVETIHVINPENLYFTTQTTLSVDETKSIVSALKKKYPKILMPKKEDICYATQNRQNAVKDLAKQADVVLVVGSKNSSNSNRLKELSEKLGVPSYLIDGPEDIINTWFDGVDNVGLTAGASAPEELVEKVISRLKITLSCDNVEILNGVEEKVFFPLPRKLKLELNKAV